MQVGLPLTTAEFEEMCTASLARSEAVGEVEGGSRVGGRRRSPGVNMLADGSAGAQRSASLGAEAVPAAEAVWEWAAVDMGAAESLLERGRTRAALRRYERSLCHLSAVGGAHCDAAWEASANAALCAVRLAEEHASGARID